MDLPTCPACGQSVLDDDVENCPFCGASMSGKPGAVASAKAPASVGPATGSGADARGSASRRAEQAKNPVADKPVPADRSQATPSGTADNDDPFAVDAAEDEAAAKAIKAAPRRMKGRTYEVQCPMCETVGFVPRRAAGKVVRCANPDCLVPVFTAPEIPEETPVEVKQSFLTPMRIFAILSGVIVLGMLIGVYVMFGGGSPSKAGNSSNGTAGSGPNDLPAPPDGSQPDGTGETVPPDDKKKRTPQAAPELSRAEMLERLPGMMVEISRINRRNRSKAYCRRLTAEVFALADDADGVSQQLKQMQFVAKELAFYRIPPLVLLAWNQLKAGQRRAAGQTADDALTAAAGLPDFGRTPIDFSTQLAALLVALDRTDAAVTLLGKHHGTDTSAQFSARLQAVAALRSNDFDAEGPASPLLAWKDPQAVAVTLELVGHGFTKAAQSWAIGQTDPTVRGDCAAAWSEASADVALQAGQRDELKTIAAVVKGLSPAVRSRCLARMAAAQLAAGDRKGAGQTLSAARSAGAGVPVPSAMILPGLKRLYSLKLADPASLRMAALAAAEIARVEARLDQKSAAWTSMTRSLNILRATAPALSAVRDRIAEIRRRGPAAIRAELRAALGLSSEDKALRALIHYRNRLDRLRAAAETRLALQVDLLARAAGWGLRDHIWTEIENRSAATDHNQQEPFLETRLPWVLAYRYLDAGDKKKARTIGTALQQAGRKPNLPEQIVRQALARLKSGDAAGAAVRLSNRQVDAAWRMQRMLAIACRLVKQDQWTSATRFVGGYADPVGREEAYQLIAALAARIGQRQAVWKTMTDVRLAPTERIALARGLMAGIR